MAVGDGRWLRPSILVLWLLTFALWPCTQRINEYSLQRRTHQRINVCTLEKCHKSGENALEKCTKRELATLKKCNMVNRKLDKEIENHYEMNKSALLLTGARQTGKTFAVRKYALTHMVICLSMDVHYTCQYIWRCSYANTQLRRNRYIIWI